MERARVFSLRGRGRLLLVAACLTAPACGSSDGGKSAAPVEPSSGPETGGTARVGLTSEPSTFLDWNAGTNVNG